ncbi:MAG: flagellar export protein FliJ [Syntrophales bacterium]|jgi:flagellar export protein FliJ|nr:flagellar export protein FliJ [Syntrophales bacterium]MDY0043102.1 flagellar export protein FliJ [Syntrophales bacterium]
MTLFKFSLQSILDYRINSEEKLLLELASSRKELKNDYTILKFLKDKQRCILNELEDGLPKRAHIIGAYFAHIGAVSEKIKKQKEVIEKKTQEMTKRQDKVLEAVKERKKLELLKEKQLIDHKSALRKTEDKRLDEFSVMRTKMGENHEENDRDI